MTTIYQLAHSPFCIPVVAIFKALGRELHAINVSNGDRRQIIELTGGAYYQVPVLIDDSTIIWESGSDTQDVARHIDRHHANGRLFPSALEGPQEILLRYLENDVEGITFRLTDIEYVPAIPDLVERISVVRHKERKFGRGCLDRWRSKRRQLLAEATNLLAPLDATLQHSRFLFGNAPVYSDYLLYGIIGNLTYRNYNELPASLSALAAWHSDLADYHF